MQEAQHGSSSLGAGTSSIANVKTLDQELNNALLQLKGDLGPQREGGSAGSAQQSQQQHQDEDDAAVPEQRRPRDMGSSRRALERASKHHVTAVDIPLSAAVYRNRRKTHMEKLGRVEQARPLIFQHQRFKAARSLSYTVDFHPDDIQHVLLEFFTTRVQECELHRRLLLTRWSAIAKRGMAQAEQQQQQQHLDVAMEAVTAEEQEAREVSRRLSAAASSRLPNTSRVLPEDVHEYLRHVVADTTVARTFHYFVNQCRWLPLAQSPELKEDMHTPGFSAPFAIPGGITDAVRTAAKLRSSSQSLRNDSHQHATGNALSLSPSTVADHHLVRDALPPLSTDVDGHYAWLLVMAVACGLDPPSPDAHHEVELFYHVKRIFKDVFTAQAERTQHKVYPAKPHEEAATLASHNAATHATQHAAVAALHASLSSSSHTTPNTGLGAGGDSADDLVDSDISVVYLKAAGLRAQLLPTLDHMQERQTARLLRLLRAPDELLKTEIDFARRHDVEYAELHLKQRLSTLVAHVQRMQRARHRHRQAQQHKTLSVASYQGGDMFAGGVWNTMYKSTSASASTSASKTREAWTAHQHEDNSSGARPKSGLRPTKSAGASGLRRQASYASASSHAGGEGQEHDNDDAEDDDDDEDQDELSKPGHGRNTHSSNEGVLGYLLLRHLHTRALREEALSILNYTTSVTRTLSHFVQELQTVSESRDHVDRIFAATQADTPHVTRKPGGASGSGGVAAAVAAASAAGAVGGGKRGGGDEDEGDDQPGIGPFVPDTYTFHSPLIDVRDTNGLPVLYEEAKQQFETLEDMLLALGTHYLQRACGESAPPTPAQRRRRQSRAQSARGHSRGDGKGAGASRAGAGAGGGSSSSRKGKKKDSSSGGGSGEVGGNGEQEAEDVVREDAHVDTDVYGQSNTDRSAILHDLWLWEVAYLREKRRLLDHHLWAIHHCRHPERRRKLLQRAFDLLHRRPRYDLEDEYFAQSYFLACEALRLEKKLVRDVEAHYASLSHALSPIGTNSTAAATANSSSGGGALGSSGMSVSRSSPARRRSSPARRRSSLARNPVRPAGSATGYTRRRSSVAWADDDSGAGGSSRMRRTVSVSAGVPRPTSAAGNAFAREPIPENSASEGEAPSSASEGGTGAVDLVHAFSVDDGTPQPPPFAMGDVNVATDVVALLPDVVSFSVEEAARICRPESHTAYLRLRNSVLARCISAFEREKKLTSIGRECSDTARRFGVNRFLDTPSAVVNKVQGATHDQSKAALESGASDADVTKLALRVGCTALEFVRSRHTLLQSFHECVVLSQLYRRICDNLRMGEHHAFVRPVTFNSATLAKISDLESDDPFVSGRYDFALAELDDVMLENALACTPEQFGAFLEKSLGRSTKAEYQPSPGAAAAASSGAGDKSSEREEGTDSSLPQRELWLYTGPLGDMRVLVHAQTVHLHLLTACVNHAQAFQGCFTPQARDMHGTIQRLVREEQEDMADGRKSPMDLAASLGFVSLQMVKRRARAAMHEEYFRLTSSRDPFLLKREMVYFFGEKVAEEQETVVLRTQLALYLASLQQLLDAFPSTRNYYFLPGSPDLHEKRLKEMNGMMETPNARRSLLEVKMSDKHLSDARERAKRSPLQILSRNADTLLNPWYLPYPAEILSLYAHLPVGERKAGFESTLKLVAPLHDIVMFLCAHARLGSSHARLGTYDVAFQGVGADWGGTEGIGTELRKIKKEIGQLPDASKPQQVADYLRHKRNIMFLEWNLTVKHYVRETFLGMKDQHAYDLVTANIHTGLPPLGASFTQPSVTLCKTHVLPRHMDGAAKRNKFGSAWFQQRTGPFALCEPFYSRVAEHMEMCLSKLTDMERHTSNGEVLGLSLLLEDVTEQEFAAEEKNVLQRLQMLSEFLETSTQLEQLRRAWGRIMLGFAVDTPSTFEEFVTLFDSEIVNPVVRRIKATRSQTDSTMPAAKAPVRSTAGSLVGHGTALELHGVPEWEYRKMLVDELKAQVEAQLLRETIKLVTRVHTRVVEEATKESDMLPYQLWLSNTLKSTNIQARRRRKMSTSLNVPRHIARCSLARDFVHTVLSVCQHNEAEPEMVAVPMQRLLEGLQELAVGISTREKERYRAFNDLYKAVVDQLRTRVERAERVIEQMKLDFATDLIRRKHEVQCGIADRTQDLVHEITALRAKVSRLREEKKTQERDIRERVKRDYDDLVNNLFSTSFSLKNRFEEYRLSLYEDVVQGMFDVRKNALQRMKMISVGKSTEKLERGLNRAEDLRNVQSENASLTALVLKMRTMNDWKRTGLRSFYGQRVYQALLEATAVKKSLWETQLQMREKTTQHQHEVTSLRAELVQAKKRIDLLENNYNEEKRARTALQQWKASKSQLIVAVEQQAKKYARLNVDVEDVLAELDTRTQEAEDLRRTLERSEKAHTLEKTRLKSELKKAQQQLNQEIQAKQHLLSQASTPAHVDAGEGDTFDFSSSSSRLRLSNQTRQLGRRPMSAAPAARRSSSLSALPQSQRRPATAVHRRTFDRPPSASSSSSTGPYSPRKGSTLSRMAPRLGLEAATTTSRRMSVSSQDPETAQLSDMLRTQITNPSHGSH